MNTAYYIARRISGAGRFSGPLIKIAIAGVAIGIAVMIIALAVINGFQTEVRNKIIGFGSHIQIQKFDENNSPETPPISSQQEFLSALEHMDGVRHVQTFATKAGLIKAGEEIQGVVFKGIGSDYDGSFFSDKMISGKIIHLSDTAICNDVIISKSISKLLKIQQDDELRMFFLVDGTLPPRGRKFHVAGIYETGLEELDKMFVIGDIQHIRRLNGWDKDAVSGFEVLVDNFEQLPELFPDVEALIPYDLEAISIHDLYPQIFDWLNLQDINVVIIIVLMILISGITMISTLLIIILERTETIGVLQALGSSCTTIRHIFLLIATKIILFGMIFGNIFGIGLALLQQRTGIVRLPQEAYYMTNVPILMHPTEILLINLGTLLLCLLMMWLPIYFITKKSSIKTISYR